MLGCAFIKEEKMGLQMSASMSFQEEIRQCELNWTCDALQDSPRRSATEGEVTNLNCVIPLPERESCGGFAGFFKVSRSGNPSCLSLPCFCGGGCKSVYQLDSLTSE